MELREQIARMPIATHKYKGRRYLTIDCIEKILALMTDRCANCDTPLLREVEQSAPKSYVTRLPDDVGSPMIVCKVSAPSSLDECRLTDEEIKPFNHGQEVGYGDVKVYEEWWDIDKMLDAQLHSPKLSAYIAAREEAARKEVPDCAKCKQYMQVEEEKINAALIAERKKIGVCLKSKNKSTINQYTLVETEYIQALERGESIEGEK